MVDQSDTDQLAGLGHASRERQILGAGRRIAAGVGVKQHEPRRIAQQANNAKALSR